VDQLLCIDLVKIRFQTIGGYMIVQKPDPVAVANIHHFHIKSVKLVKDVAVPVQFSLSDINSIFIEYINLKLRP
jgi:hypothetical protein